MGQLDGVWVVGGGVYLYLLHSFYCQSEDIFIKTWF